MGESSKAVGLIPSGIVRHGEAMILPPPSDLNPLLSAMLRLNPPILQHDIRISSSSS